MNNEPQEKVDDVVNKDYERAMILTKARNAKKTKKDLREELTKVHINELENINAHISKIYSQINTIVTMLPSGKTKRTEEQEDELPAKKKKDKEDVVVETRKPLVIGDPNPVVIGEILGKIVGSFFIAGGLFFIKRYLQPVERNKAHARYNIF